MEMVATRMGLDMVQEVVVGGRGRGYRGRGRGYGGGDMQQEPGGYNNYGGSGAMPAQGRGKLTFMCFFNLNFAKQLIIWHLIIEKLCSQT